MAIVDVREHTPDGTKPTLSRSSVTTPAPDAVLLKPLAARVYMADIVAIAVVLVMGAV